jgi:hypothetical protein
MNRMRTERSTAVTVGVLYVLATAAGGVAAAVASAPVSADELAADQVATLVGALASAVMAVACMGVTVMVYPITGDPNSPASTLLHIPISVQGKVLAIWLIGWGLRPTTAHTLTLERSSSWMPTPAS